MRVKDTNPCFYSVLAHSFKVGQMLVRLIWFWGTIKKYNLGPLAQSNILILNFKIIDRPMLNGQIEYTVRLSKKRYYKLSRKWCKNLQNWIKTPGLSA